MERHITTTLLIMLLYGGVSSLWLMNHSGGADILAINTFMIFLILNTLFLLVWWVINLLRKQKNEGIKIQLFTAGGILLSIWGTNTLISALDWYAMPVEKRMQISREKELEKTALYNRWCEGNKIGFSDSSGDLVIPCIYEDADIFLDDSTNCVKLNGKWGFINKKGKVFVDFQFEEAEKFSGRLAAVKKDNLWGFINLKGRWVVLPKYDKIISPFNNAGIAIVEKDWEVIKIDTLGNKIK